MDKENKSKYHITEFFDIIDSEIDENKFYIKLKNVKTFDGFIVDLIRVDLPDDEDGENLKVDLVYDVVYVPDDVNTDELSENDKLFFENMVSDIFYYLLKLQFETENLNYIGTDDTKESGTE